MRSATHSKGSAKPPQQMRAEIFQGKQPWEPRSKGHVAFLLTPFPRAQPSSSEGGRTTSCTHQWGGLTMMEVRSHPEAGRGLFPQHWWSWAGAAWVPPVAAPQPGELALAAGTVSRLRRWVLAVPQHRPNNGRGKQTAQCRLALPRVTSLGDCQTSLLPPCSGPPASQGV